MKRMFLVMRLLILYILQCFIHNRLAHRKCSVTTLPFELRIMGIYRFYPSAAVSFHFFDNM